MSQELGEEETGRLVSVLLPLPLGPYTYVLPGTLNACEGLFVEVPLGPRRVIGVIWDKDEANEEIDPAKLKQVIRVIDFPPLKTPMRRFLEFVSHYNFRPLGTILALTMRSRQAFEPARMKRLVVPTGAEPTRKTAARLRVLEAAQDGFARTAAELAEAAGTSPSVIKGLTDQGIFKTLEVPADAPFETPETDFQSLALSEDQTHVAQALIGAVRDDSFSALLLDGVTGSGKTEVYFEAIAEALRGGRQVLVLLPEIALTHQLLKRFEARFGCAPAAWHSGMSGPERRRTYVGIATGQARVVVGARSALFLPFADLGLLIIDEEHDSSFKQEDGIIYHARDMGVVRASLGHFPIILASATPSLESLGNAQSGKYRHLSLASRHGAAGMPEIGAIDMRGQSLSAEEFLSADLIEAINETLEAGEQTLLYLNRRGYAPLTICRACGHRMMSPDSSSWLVEHRFQKRLVCHHSGYSIPKPDACPECGTPGSLAPCGPGVERIAEEARKHFPDARTEILSSDAAFGTDEARALFQRMEDGDIDILIGTQIVAKGHNFLGLTLVGVVDADLGLKGGDLRAAERTYQLLHQVAGRAGRAEKPGRVLLQTFMPNHPIVEALVSGDRDTFLEREAEEREEVAMPPFGRLVAVVVSGPHERDVQDAARALARKAPASNALLLGPTPAALALLRGRFRYRLLLKAPKTMNVQTYLRDWFKDYKPSSSVRVSVDVDPYSFL
jgi:primosomal protein N' (replication factor Y) (superfamily II helicase)